MYRTEEETPEQMIDKSLAKLKEAKAGMLFDYAEAYESANTLSGFLRDQSLGSTMLTILGAMGFGVYTIVSWSLWPLLGIPGVALAIFLFLWARYPFYWRGILSDPLCKAGWQLYAAYNEMVDRLDYFKKLFALEGSEGKLFSAQSKANIARQLSARSEKIARRIGNFVLLIESHRLSAKLKTHAAYLEEGDIPEAAKLLGEGTRVEEAALAEVSADAEAIALVLKK